MSESRVPLMSMREALYDVEWQVMRTRTLSRYNLYGGWDTPDGVSHNILDLEAYRRATAEHDEAHIRIYRIYNLLTTILKYYRGSEKWRSEMYDKVMIYRASLPRHNNGAAIQWSWAKVHEDLVQLQKDDPDLFNNVRREITSQLRKSIGDRPELRKFADLMKEVASATRSSGDSNTLPQA